jgi:invasion protein IalB
MLPALCWGFSDVTLCKLSVAKIMNARTLLPGAALLAACGVAVLGGVYGFNLAAEAQAPAPKVKAQAKEPQPAPQAPAGPVRTETITYDAWTVNCRETPDGKSNNKACSAMLSMVTEQQNQRITLGGWVIGRNNQNALVAVLQTPQTDLGVLIPKGVELTVGKGKPRQISYVNCNPRRCEALMPVDDATAREWMAGNDASATVKFWKADGGEFAINIQSIKGVDKAIAAVR